MLFRGFLSYKIVLMIGLLILYKIFRYLRFHKLIRTKSYQLQTISIVIIDHRRKPNVNTNSCFNNIKMSLDVNISEPDEFNCSELHSSIYELAKLKEIDNFVYHVDYICGKGENFISNVFRIVIKDAEKEDQHSFIVKTLINTARQELFHELHEREVKTYETIVKKYEELQGNVPDELKVIFPKCEYKKIKATQEVIILEDMQAKGYKTSNTLANYELLDYTEASSAVKELAKFHALSLIYEKQDAETFASIKSDFQDIIFSDEFINKSKLRNYFQESFGMSFDLVEDLKAKTKLEIIQPRLLDLLKMYTRPGENNVVCHGDCWINNIMFKHEENEETKVCFIDFQATRYASPLTDVFYFIFLCTDSGFRKLYLNNLMEDYYSNLKSFLSLYSIDVNSVYTKKAFDNDCTEFEPFGLLVAMVELRIVTTSEDEAIMNGSKIVPDTDVTKVPGDDIYYRIRVNDVVNECEENGVLDQLMKVVSNLEENDT